MKSLLGGQERTGWSHERNDCWTLSLHVGHAKRTVDGIERYHDRPHSQYWYPGAGEEE
jgi:hypothetical protein